MSGVNLGFWNEQLLTSNKKQDPRKLLRSCHPHTSKFLHGNPLQDQRVVLSKDLLDKGELAPVTVVKNSHIGNEFLKEVPMQSQKAMKEEAPLVLFPFCHGLRNYSFLLDYAMLL